MVVDGLLEVAADIRFTHDLFLTVEYDYGLINY